MVDREKVIKGLKLCAGTNENAWETHSTCDLDCPYAGTGCVDNLMTDALTLLKEQEEKLAMMRMIYGTDAKVVGKIVRCKDCIHFVPENAEEGDSSGHCRNRFAPCENQTVDMWWFCADGERRTDDA